MMAVETVVAVVVVLFMFVCLAAAESDGKSLITLVTYNYHDGIPSCMLR